MPIAFTRTELGSIHKTAIMLEKHSAIPDSDAYRLNFHDFAQCVPIKFEATNSNGESVYTVTNYACKIQPTQEGKKLPVHPWVWLVPPNVSHLDAIARSETGHSKMVFDNPLVFLKARHIAIEIVNQLH